MKTGLEGASFAEKILLGWWVWAFLALVFKNTLPLISQILLAPIVFPLSSFLSQEGISMVIGIFISFSWVALIIGGILNSQRRRSQKAKASQTLSE